MFLKIKTILNHKSNFPLKTEEKLRLARELAKKKRIKGSPKKILFWIPGGMKSMVNVEACLAKALELRAAKVDIVICDGVLSGCVNRDIIENTPINKWRDKCSFCFRSCQEVVESLGLSCRVIGDFISKQRRKELAILAQKIPLDRVIFFNYLGVEVGRYALSSALRYLKGRPIGRRKRLIREYLYSALVTAEAAANCFKEKKPDRIFTSHGIYVEWGPPLVIAAQRKIPVTVWSAAYKKDHFYLRTGIGEEYIYIRNLARGTWQRRQKKHLTEKEKHKLADFLKQRYFENKSFDIQTDYLPPQKNEDLLRKLKLSKDKPIWAVFAHAIWDAELCYLSQLYRGSEPWLTATINIIKNIKNVTWILKMHPAEILASTVYKTQALLRAKFPKFPSNIKIIPSETDINPLSLYSLVDGGVTIYGTPGLELTLQGKPVIVAGNAHYSKRGFTYESKTKAEYKKLLNSAATLPALSPKQKQLAYRYAYSYFIQRQIPMPKTIRSLKGGWWQIDFSKLKELVAERDPVLDMVCDKIMNGGEFIFE